MALVLILLRQQTATAETQHAQFQVYVAMNCVLKAQDSQYNEESLCWSVCSGVNPSDIDLFTLGISRFD